MLGFDDKKIGGLHERRRDVENDRIGERSNVTYFVFDFGFYFFRSVSHGKGEGLGRSEILPGCPGGSV